MSQLTGIDSTWEELCRLDPNKVRTRTGVSFDEKLQLYTVRAFDQDIYVSVFRREVYSDSLEGTFLLGIKDYFFDLSVLWYLIGGSDIPLTGDLIKPSGLPGGQIFIQGTHVLPLDKIAQRFNNNKEDFFEAGYPYGAIRTDMGDAGLKLLPFPMVPVYLILWFGDEDFTPKGQLLLDSTCSRYLSTDVVWAMTMVCCLLFLNDI